MKDEIKKILKERGSIYGDYKGGVEFRMSVMRLVMNRYKEVHGEAMRSDHWCYLWDIVNKISRLAVSPRHVDSWRDIIGYSKRILESLELAKLEELTEDKNAD